MKILHLVIITVFLITATVLLTIPYHAYASTCAVKETIYSAPEFFLLSDNVFVGNVTSITDYGNHQWQVHFNIEKIWKGAATRQTSTVMAHTLQACGYSITVGEKYLIYTNGSPSTINPISSKMYSDAQNDIALFDDPKFQDEEKVKEDLNKKLEIAQGTVGSMMMDKSSRIPINGVGVDEVNSTLDIMIDDERATLSVEQYTQNLKNILGDIPIKVEFGHATTSMPILHNANDSGLTTSHPIIHGSTSSNVLKSPLQQFKEGIKPKDVTCWKGLQLIFKAEDQTPICVKPDNVKKLESRGWAISHYHDPGDKPKITLYDYSYDGIDKDNGMVSINNQTFYQTTLDYSVYDLPKKASTSFHDVVFAFPQGSLNTPGASFVMLDMKFYDGFEEIYGGTALVQNGTVTKIGGIPIPTQYGPHIATNSITILGNHTMPQAGITIYHDKIKLLVSQLSTEHNNVVNNTAQVVPQCLTNISNQTVFSGYAGSLSCPIMGYNVSSEMENYTGFHEISNTLYASSVVGPNTYVGTLQEELDKSGNGRMEENLVLEPGHNATITYKITLHTVKCNGECPDKFNFPTQVNLTNNVELVHRENNEMSYSHEGLVVKYDPSSESLVDGQTVTLKASIYASKDVPRGTYWLILVPGNCVGGPLVLLTISDCEK